jgi:putative hydrolase
VQWLPGHIQGLLDSYLGSVQIDEEGIKRVAQRAQELAKRLVAGERVDLLDLLVTPEQRGTLERVQATMSVLEGHGEFVMDEVGAKLVPGHDRMKRILHERRQASGPGTRLVQEILGLRQKLDQYSQGEAFVRRLYERGGMEAVNRVFVSPDALPTVDEVRDPDRYLARAG